MISINTSKTMLECIIQLLPEEIKREILYFIIPDSRTITFRNYLYYQGSYLYNKNYDVAYININIIKNKNGWYLYRILKKNGKHRYYLRKEFEKWYCYDCGEYYCNSKTCCGKPVYEFYYQSIFVGKNIDNALLELFESNRLLC